MIFHPKPGMRVTVNYKDKSMPWQGSRGVVWAVGIGPGPINAVVWIVSGGIIQNVVIPRGNLVLEKEE